jgi:hypothetical protein
MTEETLKSYGPCPKHGLWHDLETSCLECLFEAAKREELFMRCARCGTEEDCETFDKLTICETCLRLVLEEWRIRKREYAELAS